HRSGILRMERIGNQHHYQANPDCAIYNELVAIVKKTMGVVAVINEALSPLAGQVSWAFIFGSVASGRENASSDIDLMIIGDVQFMEVANALFPVQEELGREVNPKIFLPGEWVRLLAADDAFVREVMNKPHMDVMGN